MKPRVLARFSPVLEYIKYHAVFNHCAEADNDDPLCTDSSERSIVLIKKRPTQPLTGLHSAVEETSTVFVRSSTGQKEFSIVLKNQPGVGLIKHCARHVQHRAVSN